MNESPMYHLAVTIPTRSRPSRTWLTISATTHFASEACAPAGCWNQVGLYLESC